MQLRKGQLKGLAWVAIVATLMLSLAPTMASVLRGANYAAWVNVCRTATLSVGAVAPAANGPSQPADTGHLRAHCPYCALHVDALPPAPNAPDVPRDILPAFTQPQAFLHAPSTGHVWLHALSRAPPCLA